MCLREDKIVLRVYLERGIGREFKINKVLQRMKTGECRSCTKRRNRFSAYVHPGGRYIHPAYVANTKQEKEPLLVNTEWTKYIYTREPAFRSENSYGPFIKTKQ